MNLKNIFIVMLVIGILTISTVSAEQNINVSGVDFVLSDKLTITHTDEDAVFFTAEDGIVGYVAEIQESDIPDYVENNSEMGHYVTNTNSNLTEADVYSYSDEETKGGYFVVFEKDNKLFAYLFQKDFSNINDNNEMTEMAFLFQAFLIDNEGLNKI